MSSLIHWGTVAVAAVVALLVQLVVAMFGDELRGWIQAVPRGLLRLAIRRVPEAERAARAQQWRTQLEQIAERYQEWPVSRLMRSMRFALGRYLTGGPRVPKPEPRPSVGQVLVQSSDPDRAALATGAPGTGESPVPPVAVWSRPTRSRAEFLNRYYLPAARVLGLIALELAPFGLWLHYLGVLVESHRLYEAGGWMLEAGLGAGLAVIAPYLIVVGLLVAGLVVAVGGLALLLMALPFSKPIDKLAKRLDGKDIFGVRRRRARRRSAQSAKQESATRTEAVPERSPQQGSPPTRTTWMTAAALVPGLLLFLLPPVSVVGAVVTRIVEDRINDQHELGLGIPATSGDQPGPAHDQINGYCGPYACGGGNSPKIGYDLEGDTKTTGFGPYDAGKQKYITGSIRVDTVDGGCVVGPMVDYAISADGKQVASGQIDYSGGSGSAEQHVGYTPLGTSGRITLTLSANCDVTADVSLLVGNLPFA